VEEKNYIYVSCSSADYKKIRPVVKRLEKDGFTVVSSNGEECKNKRKVPGLIKRCNLFLAFVSSNYIKDKDCLDQLDYARNKTAENARLIIYIEEVNLPDSFEMRYGRFQAIYMCRYKKVGDFFKKLYSTEKLKNMMASQKIIGEEPTHKKKKRTAVALFAVVGIVLVAICLYIGLKNNKNNTASGRVSLGNDIYIDGVYNSYSNSLDVTIEVPEKDIAEEYIAMYAFAARLSVFNEYDVTFKCPSSTVSFSESEVDLTNFDEYPAPYVEWMGNRKDFDISSFVESFKEWEDKYNDYFEYLGVNKKILNASFGDAYTFSEDNSKFRLYILYDDESYVSGIYFMGHFADESAFISSLYICSSEMSEWDNIGDKLDIVFYLDQKDSEAPKWVGYYKGEAEWIAPLIMDGDENAVSLTGEQKAECYTDENLEYAKCILRDVKLYLNNLNFREE